MLRLSLLCAVTTAAAAACPGDTTNQPPTAAAQSVATNEDTARSGTLSGTDPEGGALTYALVAAPSLGSVTVNANGAFVYTPNTNAHGSDQFSFKVNDGAADSQPAVVSLTVHPVNDAPTLASANLGPGPFRTNDTVTVFPSGWSDVEGASEGYRFQWFVNEVAVNGATAATLPGQHFSRGDAVRCAVTPFDGSASGTPVSSAAATIQNSAPSVGGASLGNGPHGIHAVLTCATSAVVDADADPVSLAYDWFVNDGLLATEHGPTLARTWNGGDRIRCRVTPSDGTNSGTAITSNQASITNLPPTLASVTVVGTTPRTQDVLTCMPNGFSDPEGSPPGYLYAWLRNGTPLSGQTAPTLDGNAAFGKGDHIACRVTPTDGVTTGTPVTSSPVTILNSLPAVGSVSLGAGPFRTSDVLTCTASGRSDADGDAVAVSYQWFKNWVELSGAVTATLDGTLHFDKDDALSCAVTPHDGSEAGAAVTSVAVTISNSAPTLASASLGSGPYRTDDMLTCTASGAVDADGDAVSYRYRWLVGGVPVDGQTAPTLPGTAFRRDDTVECVITPEDGSTLGADVVSNPVTIQNSPPTLAGASIGSGPYGTNAVVPCTPSGFTDADGDAPVYRYAWFKNGAELPGQTASTLDGASHFDPGDSVRCRVTPTDGTDSGAPVDSNTLTIGLPPESFTGVSIGTGPYFTNDILTAVATGPDGETYDPAGFKYQWYRDGVALAGATSATLDGATWFSRGHTLACAMTAFDGVQTGNTFTSNTVTIQNSPPVLTSASIGTGPYVYNSTIPCTRKTGSEPDGDAVTYTYEWYRNGAVVPGWTSTFIDGRNFRKGDSIACRVTAKDATHGTTATSNTVTIQNSPPQRLEAHLALFAGTTASGQLKVYEPDGDPVLHFAIASGSAHGTAVITNSATGAFTFTAQPGYRGATSFTFTVSDGTDTSAPMTARVRVHDKRLARGEMYGCAIAPDRTLRCWGGNTSGQLGIGGLQPTESGTPVREALGLTDWASVSAGGAGDYAAGRGHVCAIRLDGSLYCWGRNDFGQVGIGTVGGDVTRPTLVDAGKWIEVAVGLRHTCGLKQDSSLWCWGRNAEGEIGQARFGGTYPSPTPLNVGPAWATLAAGAQHTCAVAFEGLLACWGQGTHYALGNLGTQHQSVPSQEATRASNWVQVTAQEMRTLAVRADGSVWTWGDTSGVHGAPYDVQPRELDRGWREVSTGPRHFCGVRSSGGLHCQGENWQGALGLGLREIDSGTGPVDAELNWVEVSSGRYGSCGRKSDGTTWCWGSNLLGQTASGTDQSHLVPTPVGTADNWREGVSRQGGSGTCATRTDGTVWCAGHGYAGDQSISVFSYKQFTQPQPVVSTWASVGAGTGHACATRTDGSLWCWGMGGGLQVTRVGTQLDWARGEKDLGAGGASTCALKVDGALHCWGQNQHGQLGLGDRTERTAPTRVAGTSTWLAVSVGDHHACGIQSDGSLWCWGANRWGQLGVPPGAASNVPERCEYPGDGACGTTPLRQGAASDWTKVAVGGGHTCALNAAGTVFCWGRNHAGQLGGGVTGPRTCNANYLDECNPVPVEVGGGFADVWAGMNHTCARKVTGQLACWGLNESGQVGDGTLVNRLSPVELDSGSAGWLDVAPGHDVTCAVRSGAGGTRPLWCWGRSDDGAFGDDHAWKSTPVRTLLP